MSKMRRNIETARKNAKVTDMFPSIKPEPMKITFKTDKDLPVTKSGKLRECSECAHSTPDCTFCEYSKKPIYPFQYACFNFISDEEEKKIFIAALQAEIYMRDQRGNSYYSDFEKARNMLIAYN